MAPKLNEGVIDQIKDFPKYKYQSTKQKSLIVELIPNELRERYIKYGLCQECNQPNTGVYWCQPCNSIHFQEDFSKWTSGSEEIDEFIRKFQLNATCYQEVLEWVPYEKFKNIEHLAERDFSTVYKAEWINGYILNWNANQIKWGKTGNIDIALKCLKNSQNLATGFLQEITFHKKFSINAHIVFCFGISQDPITKYFMMVMQYIPNGSMNQFLKSNHNRLSLDDKLYLFHNILDGLKEIHNQGCIHKDLHSDNILVFNKFTCLISDFRSCKSINEERKDDEKKFFGVMPYVAPEVLRDKIYTQAADIYSFGIVACEILLELPPYYDLSHDDELLTIKIRQGLRPKLDIVNVPLLLEKLIDQCLDAHPSKRPTANKLSNIFKVVHEFYKQEKEFNKSISSKSTTSLNTHTIYPYYLYYKNTIYPYSLYSEATAEIKIIPFAQFDQLIKEVARILEKFMDLYHAAQHNKRIAKLLLERIIEANSSVNFLRYDDLYSSTQYANLQSLIEVLQKMKSYSKEITQYNTLIIFLRTKTIKSQFNELCKDYDTSIDLLNLTLTVNFKANVEREKEILNEEIENLSKFQKALLESNLSDTSDKKLDAMNKIVEEVSETQMTILNISADQKKIDIIFNETPLPPEDYEETETSRGDRLRKYIHIKSGENRAFRTIGREYIGQVKNQLTVLKQIEICQNIIHFYGFIKDDEDKYYLITEWAENGKLSEYISQPKQNLKMELRLKFAYDIAKGLNFLNAVKILHQDIRSDNIVITNYNVAKITNFKLKRVETSTSNLAVDKESVRHKSPEMLRGISGMKDRKNKYDTKSEVYSFGILLWEIAECRTSYSQFEDFLEVTKKGINGYRESFTPDTEIPEKYQNLVKEAVHQNPGKRPTFAEMLLELQDIFKKYTSEKTTSHSDSNRPPSPVRKDSIFLIDLDLIHSTNIMALDKAVKDHKDNEDKKKLYMCFNTYANMGNPKAKYWKAYYITKGWSDLNCTPEEKNKIAAKLFKEAADYGDEFPDAQNRYAMMVTKGKGVKQNTSEGIEYLLKAAKNDHAAAMFNVATYYFSSNNEKLGKYYMIMAVNKNYSNAIEYCKKKGIPLN